MNYSISTKIFLLTVFSFFISCAAFCQDNKDGKDNKDKAIITQNKVAGGFERTIRKGNEGVNWSWGTMGHGSYDQAIELFRADEFFKPEKDVLVYKQGNLKYRVFTHANINYIEVNYGFGYFVYVTKS